MKFYEYISNLTGTTAIFVDMDGVIADYDNDPNFDKFSEGFYAKKRPIKTTIKILEEISKINNVTMYLLSGHSDDNDEEKMKEKNKWIDKNAPFFPEENRIFNNPKNINKDGYRYGKAKSIENIMDNINYDNIIQIDDDVRVIKGTNKYPNDRIQVFHVISILD